jgi:uncharacterized protein
MHQNWRRVTFLHWPVAAAVLQCRLPPGLIIDTFAGIAWVGLTPFQLTGLRPPAFPAIPWLSSFPEMNLRTYVRGPAGSGVWFFSLDAASALAVLGARASYGLPYHRASMRIQISGRRLRYTLVHYSPGVRVRVGAPSRVKALVPSTIRLRS